MTQQIDNTHAGYPYQPYAPHCLYILRTVEGELPPLSLQEWYSYIDHDPELILGETYERHNIHTEQDEIWREIGLASLQDEEQNIELHFRPAGVGFVDTDWNRILPLNDQKKRLLQAMPDNPTLQDWLVAIESSRFMEINPDQPRYAWWIGRKDQRKGILTYEPPAIWTYQQPIREMARERFCIDEQRMMLCQRIANDLNCKLEIGL